MLIVLYDGRTISTSKITFELYPEYIQCIPDGETAPIPVKMDMIRFIVSI